MMRPVVPTLLSTLRKANSLVATSPRTQNFRFRSSSTSCCIPFTIMFPHSHKDSDHSTHSPPRNTRHSLHCFYHTSLPRHVPALSTRPWHRARFLAVTRKDARTRTRTAYILDKLDSVNASLDLSAMPSLPYADRPGRLPRPSMVSYHCIVHQPCHSTRQRF